MENVNGRRCKTCWLRSHDCYCEHVKQFKNLCNWEIKKDQLIKTQNTIGISLEIDVCIYYHFMEIGRSANTAHLLEAICASKKEDSFPIHCNSAIFGNSKEEEILLDQMRPIDDLHGKRSTEDITVACVMFPSKESITLSTYIDNLMDNLSNQSSNNPSEDHKINSKVTLRLVMLDGTYPCSRRQLKHLTKCCTLPGRGYALPLVKLRLDEQKGCQSAITGVMYQPGRDKLCTYQACIMAIQQIVEHIHHLNTIHAENNTTNSHETPLIVLSSSYQHYMTLCKSLLDELDNWIAFILKTKIKFGKSKPKFANKEVLHFTPSESLSKNLGRELFRTPILRN
mmetsp:Transcript_19658/g.26932  ORF Transcript_19658/g.26932 Transcript_19658/m.26932 type:complete len:340 (+) Transcript_19658:280-1299(+)